MREEARQHSEVMSIHGLLAWWCLGDCSPLDSEWTCLPEGVYIQFRQNVAVDDRYKQKVQKLRYDSRQQAIQNTS